MATYPIKMLKDEQNIPFVPLVSTDGVQDPEGLTLEQRLLTKLGPSNLLGGKNISVRTEGYNCYIDLDLPSQLTVINNLTTASSGQGALDAYQGKVLNDKIPSVIDDITSTSTSSALSANQGYLLNNKFNNYTTTSDMNTKFDTYLPLHGTADKSLTVGNLVIRSKSMSWGTLTSDNGYTLVNAWDSPGDGGIAIADKNTNLNIQIDGKFYQDQGQYRVLDTSDLGNYAFYKFPAGTALNSTITSISKSLTITTKGRPVFIQVTGDNNPTTTPAWFGIEINRDGTKLSYQIDESHETSWNIPFSMAYLDIVGSGTYTYTVSFIRGDGDINLAEGGNIQAPNFVIYEI